MKRATVTAFGETQFNFKGSTIQWMVHKTGEEEGAGRVERMEMSIRSDV